MSSKKKRSKIKGMQMDNLRGWINLFDFVEMPEFLVVSYIVFEG